MLRHNYYICPPDTYLEKTIELERQVNVKAPRMKSQSNDITNIFQLYSFSYDQDFISDCGTLLAPSNGNIDLSGGTLFEAVALFSCDTGYTLNGASSTTCQSDATWSDPNPTCDIRGAVFLFDYSCVGLIGKNSV